MKNKLFLLFISAVLLIGFFIFGIEKFHNSEKTRLEFLSTHNSEHFVRPHSPVEGAETAKVYVSEFLDPECESCRAIYPSVKQLLNDYEGKIKVVVRYVPLHRNSEFAIRVLEASKLQGKYWEALEMMFKSQPYWADHHSPKPELLWYYLPSVGVDVEKIKNDMNSPEIQKLIDTDKADAQKLQVRGTPTFFVNGKRVEQHGIQFVKNAIEEALREN